MRNVKGRKMYSSCLLSLFMVSVHGYSVVCLWASSKIYMGAKGHGVGRLVPSPHGTWDAASEDDMQGHTRSSNETLPPIVHSARNLAVASFFIRLPNNDTETY